MDEITTTVQICVEPRYLGKNIKKHLAKKISEKYLDKCNQEYGYILEVKDDVVVKKNRLAKLGGNVFYKVECTLCRLKPNIDDEFKGKVCMVFEHGIFVEISGKMKVLVPTDKMNGYEYSKTRQYFKKGKKKIKEEEEVKIKITGVEYSNCNYNCIGKLI